MDTHPTQEASRELSSSMFQYLSSNYPNLDPNGFNTMIVEVGRWRGRMTEEIVRAWPNARVFSIDDGAVAHSNPDDFAKSMIKLQQLNVVAIQGRSPPAWTWPKAWNFDLLVLDIGSNFGMIRTQIRWWSRSAKVYQDGTRGLMLCLLPHGTEQKSQARETFFENEEGLIIHEIPGVKHWVLVEYALL